MILTFSQKRKGVTETFRKESSGRCDQRVVRPNAEAAKTPAPQCDLSPIWNLCALFLGPRFVADPSGAFGVGYVSAAPQPGAAVFPRPPEARANLIQPNPTSQTVSQFPSHCVINPVPLCHNSPSADPLQRLRQSSSLALAVDTNWQFLLFRQFRPATFNKQTIQAQFCVNFTFSRLGIT